MEKSQGGMDSYIRNYLDLRLNELRLKAIDGLSVGVIGSLAGAAFIIGGVFLIILALLLIFGKRLFVNIFVKLFIGIFYEND